MGELSTIEWTDHTFNPWWGCTKVSPACDHCYAETWARRFGVKWGAGEPRRLASERTWNEPLKWNTKAQRDEVRRRVFCASMADIFDNDGEQLDGARAWLWEIIEETPALDWLLLTKRIGNASRMLPNRWQSNTPPNLWLGISVCNQEEVDRDVPKLLATPASVHFLSCEPLLESLDLRIYMPDSLWNGLPSWKQPELDWIICGGESGACARPVHPEWIRSLRDQCVAAGVAFFFKQFGQWLPIEAVENSHTISPELLLYEKAHDMTYARVGKKAAGRLLDGRTWDEIPRTPT